MPVNYQQVLQQIREMGQQATQIEEQAQKLRAEAWRLFDQYACELDTLQQLVELAAAENPHLRCALPCQECLNAGFAALPIDSSYTLLAADGSQINPDRHASVEFGAINVGAIRVHPGQGRPPEEVVRSQMLFYHQLFTSNGGFLTDDVVALMRDIAERRELISLARQENSNGSDLIVTLTDGTLEPFREAKGQLPELEKLFETYLEVLRELAGLQVATAGYVDKPRSHLVINLLELIVLQKEGRLKQAGKDHPFLLIDDAYLFERILEPGQRSAVMAIHSPAVQSFTGELSLHFFYLNVGRPNHPYLSRVEIPQWVAASPRLLNLLHAALLSQSRMMGVRAYPYVLHRAHEIAVVGYSEREQLENMIIAELRRQGVPVGERSYKQVAKDASYS